jgi:endonuclease-8
MPEGDTVRNHAIALTRALAGQIVTRSDFRLPKLATASVTGDTVIECASRGKHLLLRLVSAAGTARTLHSHLRMDGTWRTYEPGRPWAGRPAHTIRIVLTTAPVIAVGFHLHDVALIPTADEDSVVGHLGPDLLGSDWDPDEAVRRLSLAPDRLIGEALLDQRNLAGIGNVYKCELLFLRGVSPWAPASSVPDLTTMVSLARRLIASNVGRWSQITTGSARRGEEHYVYGRAGRPCRRCGTPIRRADQGSDERVTFWCPNCQPSTSPTG